MGAAEQVVDPEVEGRLRRAELVPLLFADDLEHDLAAVLVHGLRQGLQPVEGEPDVLETYKVETGVANLVVDLEGVLDGNVVVGEHKDELGHRLIPSLFRRRSLEGPVRRPHSPPPAERARSRMRSMKASSHRPAKKSKSAKVKRSRMRCQFLRAQRAVSGETGGSSSPKRAGAPASSRAPPKASGAATIWPNSDRCCGQFSRNPSTRGRRSFHRSSLRR